MFQHLLMIFLKKTIQNQWIERVHLSDLITQQIQHN